MQNKIVLNSLHFPYTGGPQLYFKTFVNILDHEWIPKDNVLGWTASSEFGTYRLCEQRRFRRACASAQSRQNLRYSLIQAVSQEEPSDRKLDPWPLWMAGHAQLKFVGMLEDTNSLDGAQGIVFQMIWKNLYFRSIWGISGIWVLFKAWWFRICPKGSYTMNNKNI